jgi:hypothetical protein
MIKITISRVLNMNKKRIAITLRKKGLSYNVISKKIKVPKGTLSYWFKKLKWSEIITKKNIDNARKKWADNLTTYNKKRSLIAREKWSEMQKNARAEISSLSARELKLVGVALYWAGGYKRGNWNVVFCNSDSMMVILMLRFFKRSCNVPDKKIKLQIQIHSIIAAKPALKYWSKITGFSSKHFLKPIYILSRSSKKLRENRLPYGTLRIKINDVKLVNKLKGWIEGLSK